MEKDKKNLETIYESMLVEMDVASVVGSSPIGGSLENTDDYNTGDSRIAYLIGRVQTRRGKAKKLKRKRRRK